MSRRAGGCYIHHHAKGFHVHPEIARVAGLRWLQISLDPNCPRPIDRLPELFVQNAGVPLISKIHARDLPDRIDALQGGRLALMLHAGTIAEAAAAVNFIRRRFPAS